MLRSPLNLRALAISYILSMALLKMLVFISSPPWEYFVTFSTLRMVLQLSNIFVFNTPVQWSVMRSCYIMNIYSDISSMYVDVSTQTVERGHCLNKQCLSKTDSEIHNTQETVCISWLNSCSYKNYEENSPSPKTIISVVLSQIFPPIHSFSMLFWAWVMRAAV